MDRFDCAVIGGGPAGLSAAINLHQRGKTVQVLALHPAFWPKLNRWTIIWACPA